MGKRICKNCSFRCKKIGIRGNFCVKKNLQDIKLKDTCNAHKTEKERWQQI